MGLKECQIVLDNPWNTYYAGQTVNGRVDLAFDAPKKIRGINILFKGEANTSWTESETKHDADGKTREETTALTGHEEYFQIQYYLVGGKTGGEVELPAGNHSYPFTCALPPTLPSSFEGEWGHVRYTVKVTLDRPWKFDQDSKIAFTVISPVDLNLDPRAKEPVKMEVEKHFCCCWCKSGPLTLVVSLPVTGYVSGQQIPITTECDNASNVKIDTVKLTLRKNVTFYTQSPKRDVKRDSVVIAELQVGPVDAGQSKTWNQVMEVPPLPPSNLANCGLIDLDYELKVEAKTPGFHRDLSTKIPIQIGTVPLASYQPPMGPYKDLPASPMQPSIPGQNGAQVPATTPVAPEGAGWNMPPGVVSGAPVGAPHSLYPNIPPPTFAEGQFATRSIQDKYDTEHTRIPMENFAPRYPVFAFNPSAPAPPAQ